MNAVREPDAATADLLARLEAARPALLEALRTDSQLVAMLEQMRDPDSPVAQMLVDMRDPDSATGRILVELRNPDSPVSKLLAEARQGACA